MSSGACTTLGRPAAAASSAARARRGAGGRSASLAAAPPPQAAAAAAAAAQLRGALSGAVAARGPLRAAASLRTRRRPAAQHRLGPVCSSAPGDEPSGPVSDSERQYGRFLLFIVGATYGSLAAALRFVFLLPGPPTASVLSAVRGVIMAVCFIPMLAGSGKQLRSWSKAAWVAAFELCVWNFLSQGLLNVALLYTDAMRASFITQTAIVLTPLIASLGGERVGQATWVGCLFALGGVALLASDGGSTAASAAATGLGGLNMGDLLALGGAATYSIYIYRLSELGRVGLSTDLTQAVKAVLLALLYGLWAASDAMGVLGGGGTLLSMWPGWASGLAWGVLLYSAVVPGALADVLQARGQSRVGAAEAQVLLSAEPLWTALLSMLFLGERMGAAGWGGGALVVVAVMLASGVVSELLAKLRPGAGKGGDA